MPRFLLKIMNKEVPLILGLAEHATVHKGTIPSKQLFRDLSRLQPPSQIIIGECDKLTEIRSLAQAFKAQPQGLLAEVIGHMQERATGISDRNLERALLNISQAGIPYVVTQEITETLFRLYMEKEEILLSTQTSECYVYKISPTNMLATITEISLVFLDSAIGEGVLISIPGHLCCAINIPFNGNGLGLFQKRPMPSISFEFEDYSFLAEFIMTPRVIAKIQGNPNLLFDYYRACYGNQSCLVRFISAMGWLSNSLQQAILTCRSHNLTSLPNFIEGIIKRLDSVEQLDYERIAVVFALLEIGAQNQEATEKILTTFPLGSSLPLNPERVCQLWALNSSAVNAALIEKTDIRGLFTSLLRGVGSLPHDSRRLLRSLLRNPDISKAVSDLVDNMPTLVEKGIIIPQFLEYPECRHLIGLCARSTPEIFARYRSDLSDEAFIRDVKDAKIGIKPERPDGLLAILRLHTIMYKNDLMNIENMSKDEKIAAVLSLPNHNSEIASYCEHIY